MFITQLVYEGEEKEIVLDEELKEKFCSFPCEWYIKEIDGKLFVVSTAYSKGISSTIFLHQLVLECDKNEEILFYNGNTLDNRQYNLRLKRHLPKRVVKG